MRKSFKQGDKVWHSMFGSAVVLKDSEDDQARTFIRLGDGSERYAATVCLSIFK